MAASKGSGKSSSARSSAAKSSRSSGGASKSSAKGSAKSTGKSSARTSSGRASRGSGKRKLIDTGTDKRYVRRDGQGQFKESDDVGRSLSMDRNRKAKTKAPRGQGDRGDR